LRVFAGEKVDAYLDRDDAVRGYTLAYFRGRHVVEPTELTEEEAGRFWRDLLIVARAIEDEYAPIKMNLLFLGNAMPHLHVHLVPRYRDDPDAGAPPRFMMATSNWRRLDEADYLRQVNALRIRLGHQISRG
jgi:diadenosine tetraphosphate (Ap4A) HIT family hydrolase